MAKLGPSELFGGWVGGSSKRDLHLSEYQYATVSRFCSRQKD